MKMKNKKEEDEAVALSDYLCKNEPTLVREAEIARGEGLSIEDFGTDSEIEIYNEMKKDAISPSDFSRLGEYYADLYSKYIKSESSNYFWRIHGLRTVEEIKEYIVKSGEASELDIQEIISEMKKQ